MAAKEKQQAKTPTPAPPPPAAMAPPSTADLLTDFDAPATKDVAPPPSYETNFLQGLPPPAFDAQSIPPPAFDAQSIPPPAVQAPPPAFDAQMQFMAPPPMESVLPPPPPLNDVLPPPPMPAQGDLLDFGMPSAPMFEDLHTQQPQEFHPPPLPPPMEAAPPEPDIDASILNALEPAEREAFLEEQRKILAQIEQEKSNIEASGAAARAMAFDQRSSNAAANVAAAYERGIPPTADFGAVDAEVAAQMASDAELAERLQKEEYAASEQRRSRRTGRSGGSSSRQAQSSESDGQSWYGWLTGAPASAPATRSSARSSSTLTGGSSGGGGLVSAIADESVGLMSTSGGGSSGARVAPTNKSMFSCVADSMGTAVTQMYQFQADDDGNVHGVDSQGLLAMPDVSRERENYD